MKKITLLLLLQLCIFSEASSESYSRVAFTHWSDLNQDGKNTRQELIESSSKVGMWIDPYSGKIFISPNEMDADHIVPLKYAWEHGAEAWTPDKREFFANDDENLLLVDRRLNRSKGAKSPMEWLPPNLAFSEEYVVLFIRVCVKYNLSCPTDQLIELEHKLKSFNNGLSPLELK